MRILFESKPSHTETAFFEQALFAFNRSKIGDYSYEDFTFKAIDSSDAVVAGIHGQVGGGWLYIASLWVDEDHRGKGIGRQLLCSAEKTAAEKNCHGAYLYTYSFQSPRYYQKFGYRIFGELEHSCGEHTKFFLKKIFE